LIATTRRAAFVPYPFAAIVGQDEAKLAVLLAAINPRIGGVLLSGAKGIGKTSIVRGIADLLPIQRRARCAYGCDPDGATACADCTAAGAERGRPLRARAAVVELPANAQIDDVVGTIDLRAALERGTVTFRPGLLAQANRAVLYVDEINLLSDVVVDVLLDSAAQGVVHVKRGQHSIEYPSRFTLIGTMNPEEGELRPQITDRLGLRVFSGAVHSGEERAEIYRRNAAFSRDPQSFSEAWGAKTRALRARVARAVTRLPGVRVDDDACTLAIETVTRLGIESHRTEFVALEAACALAAFEGRDAASADDVRRCFPLAARLRRSRLRVQAQTEYHAEDVAISAALDAAGEAAESAPDAPPDHEQLVVSPEMTDRQPRRARAQTQREGQPVGTQPLSGGRIDVPATVLDRSLATRTPITPDLKQSVDAAVPLHLTVFIVDASQSTAQSADAVNAVMQELLRPIYAERERAALISCWGASADLIIDENVGRNVELVAQRLSELTTDEKRTLTPLPDALEQARRIAERFRRANPNGDVEIAVFSDGRANVPLGGEAELRAFLESGADARGLTEIAAEQCRTLAARFAGRATSTFVNLDGFESSALMRELASIARGRYFAINDVVARVSSAGA
jgi:Mg-chelatase subunit ChlI/predicted transcriptional regulator